MITCISDQAAIPVSSLKRQAQIAFFFVMPIALFTNGQKNLLCSSRKTVCDLFLSGKDMRKKLLLLASMTVGVLARRRLCLNTETLVDGSFNRLTHEIPRSSFQSEQHSQ